MSSRHPTSLFGLSQREEILDTIYRAAFGLDDNNYELFKTAFVADGKTEFSIGPQRTIGMEKLKSDIFDDAGPMDTTHTLSAPRVDYQEGSDKVKLVMNATAMHGKPGQGSDPAAGRFLTGSICHVDLEKDEEGAWKIRNWELDLKSVQGDQSVFGWRQEQAQAQK